MDLPASMYLNYLARRKTDYERLKSALAAGNAVEDFKTIGHQIKGNAISFGFDDLVSIGERMEVMNPAQQTVEAKELVAEFSKWISKTEKRLAEELPNEAGS